MMGGKRGALCSKDFQNVKLSSTIQEYICHSISNLREIDIGKISISKISIFTISVALKFELC